MRFIYKDLIIVIIYAITIYRFIVITYENNDSFNITFLNASHL